MLSDQFAQIFRQEHWQAWDTPLELVQADLNLIQWANEVERRPTVGAE